jgi:hypothetical protein
MSGWKSTTILAGNRASFGSENLSSLTMLLALNIQTCVGNSGLNDRYTKGFRIEGTPLGTRKCQKANCRNNVPLDESSRALRHVGYSLL